jgi:hypothetical protein
VAGRGGGRRDHGAASWKYVPMELQTRACSRSHNTPRGGAGMSSRLLCARTDVRSPTPSPIRLAVRGVSPHSSPTA